MKVLTIKQPWANLIIMGHKNIENRSWPTKYRGRFLIHSSKTIDHNAMTKYENMGLIDRNDCSYGAIIGSVELVDCIDCRTKFPRDEKWWDGSAYAFKLANPRWEQIFFMKGKLNFYSIPENVVVKYLGDKNDY